MTTIIGINQKIYADRRKVMNNTTEGMVGAEHSDKITTTSFCHYATTGFVPEGHQAKQIEHTLAAIFVLLHVAYSRSNFRKSEAGKLFYAACGMRRIKYTTNMLIDRLKVYCMDAECSLMAVNDTHHVLVRGKDTAYGTKNTCSILGAGSKMAAILLHHKEPIESVYDAVRGAGLPTGAAVDMKDGAIFANDKIAPITNPYFVGRVTFELEQFVSNLNPADTSNDGLILITDVLSMISMLYGMGHYNTTKDRVVFRRNLTVEKIKTFGLPGSKFYDLALQSATEKL